MQTFKSSLYLHRNKKIVHQTQLPRAPHDSLQKSLPSDTTQWNRRRRTAERGTATRCTEPTGWATPMPQPWYGHDWMNLALELEVSPFSCFSAERLCGLQMSVLRNIKTYARNREKGNEFMPVATTFRFQKYTIYVCFYSIWTNILFPFQEKVAKYTVWSKTTLEQQHVLCFFAQNKGGQLIVLGGHFEKAAFSGGPYLPMEVETSLSWFSLSTSIYCDKLKEISDVKVFLNACVGHWNRCGGPHLTRGPLFANPWLRTIIAWIEIRNVCQTRWMQSTDSHQNLVKKR